MVRMVLGQSLRPVWWGLILGLLACLACLSVLCQKLVDCAKTGRWTDRLSLWIATVLGRLIDRRDRRDRLD